MPDPITIILILVAVFVVVALATGIRVVPQKRAFIIERLGKYMSTWEAGLHIKIPLIQKIIYSETRLLDYDAPRMEILAADKKNLTIEIFAHDCNGKSLLF